MNEVHSVSLRNTAFNRTTNSYTHLNYNTNTQIKNNRILCCKGFKKISSTNSMKCNVESGYEFIFYYHRNLFTKNLIKNGRNRFKKLYL